MAVLLERTATLHESVPPFEATYGDLAADVGQELGYDVDGDQRAILDAVFAYDPASGLPAFTEVAVIAPRQNLKTATGIIAAVTDMVVFGLPHRWSSHLYRPTTLDAFNEMWGRIDGSRLRSEFDDPIAATGKELIRLRSGQWCEFDARSKKAGRGTARARTTLDEALFLTPAQVSAMFPTGVTKRDRQRRIFSSAGLAESEYLRQVRDRGRAGTSTRLAYFEWGAPPTECALPSCPHMPPGEVEGCALDDVELWKQANPAFGRRIFHDGLADMRESMTAEGFAVEFLSWWEDPADLVDGLPIAWWDECESTDAVLADPVVLAIDADENHASSSIAACGGPLELVQFGRGVDWLPKRLAELVERQKPSAVGFETSGPVAALLPDLEAVGLHVRDDDHPTGVLVGLGAPEMVRACGGLWIAAQDRTLVQHGERALRIAVRDAKRRTYGDAWRWSRRGSQSDISPLVAATIARFLWVRGEEDTDSIYETREMVVL